MGHGLMGEVGWVAGKRGLHESDVQNTDSAERKRCDGHVHTCKPRMWALTSTFYFLRFRAFPGKSQPSIFR
ncbi:hypothetical protein ACLOJK_018084, partial [Asimina triloba]